MGITNYLNLSLLSVVSLSDGVLLLVYCLLTNFVSYGTLARIRMGELACCRVDICITPFLVYYELATVGITCKPCAFFFVVVVVEQSETLEISRSSSRTGP